MRQTQLNTSLQLEIGESKKLITQIHANAQLSRVYTETSWLRSVKKRLGITEQDLKNCFNEIKNEAVA